MICRIAELLVDVPAAGGMTPRCAGYIEENQKNADIVISSELYNAGKYSGLTENDVAYMESGFQFYRNLLFHDGLMLHASAVAYEGYAYLFSGPCGMGKSTHARLWQQVFGEKAVIFNDDKPALRCVDGKWFAYGTPWCGKDGINGKDGEDGKNVGEIDQFEIIINNGGDSSVASAATKALLCSVSVVCTVEPTAITNPDVSYSSGSGVIYTLDKVNGTSHLASIQ